MMGRDGGTERFFLRLTQGFHEAGIEQEFAVRPAQIWPPELAPRGRVHQATYLRRDPISLLRLWGLHRQIARFAPAVGAAIARLEADPARRARLAQAGAATLAARFSKEAVIAQYVTLFQNLAEEKAQR